MPLLRGWRERDFPHTGAGQSKVSGQGCPSYGDGGKGISFIRGRVKAKCRGKDAPPTGMAGKGFPSYGGRVKAKCRGKDASSGQGCPSYGVDDGGKGIFTIHYLGDIGYMLNWKKPTWKHLFIFLLILHVAPLWVFTYFPTQDGPSHIYNALTLIEHHKHENYTMRDIWKLNITIFPNWMSHIIPRATALYFPTAYHRKNPRHAYHWARANLICLFSQCRS